MNNNLLKASILSSTNEEEPKIKKSETSENISNMFGNIRINDQVNKDLFKRAAIIAKQIEIEEENDKNMGDKEIKDNFKYLDNENLSNFASNQFNTKINNEEFKNNFKYFGNENFFNDTVKKVEDEELKLKIKLLEMQIEHEKEKHELEINKLKSKSKPMNSKQQTFSGKENENIKHKKTCGSNHNNNNTNLFS